MMTTMMASPLSPPLPAWHNHNNDDNKDKDEDEDDNGDSNGDGNDEDNDDNCRLTPPAPCHCMADPGGCGGDGTL
jgi:hypothetical protein